MDDVIARVECDWLRESRDTSAEPYISHYDMYGCTTHVYCICLAAIRLNGFNHVQTLPTI